MMEGSQVVERGSRKTGEEAATLREKSLRQDILKKGAEGELTVSCHVWGYGSGYKHVAIHWHE
jgi:hypothetical protein